MISDGCRLCGNALLEPFGVYDLRISNESTRAAEGKPSLLVKCSRCGVVFRDEFPGEEIAGEYEGAYYSQTPVLEDHVKFLYSLRWRKIRRYVPRGARVLDFGCGKGYFLHQLRAMGREDIHGVELNRSAQVSLRGQNFDVAGQVSELDEPGPYDVITLFHVLEHLEDPKGFLVDLKESLGEGGRLVIEVPNLDGFGFGKFGAEWFYLQREHLYYFNEKSLISLLERAGYTVEKHYCFGGFLVTKGRPGRKKLLALPPGLKKPLLYAYLRACDFFGLHDFIGVVARK